RGPVLGLDMADLGAGGTGHSPGRGYRGRVRRAEGNPRQGTGNGLTAGVGGRAMAVPAPGPPLAPPACPQARARGERGRGRPSPEIERRGHLTSSAAEVAHARVLGVYGTPPRGCFGHGVRTERDAGGARCGLPAGRAATATRQDASVSPEGDEDRA